MSSQPDNDMRIADTGAADTGAADTKTAARAGTGRRSGRRPGLSSTREDIIRAARKVFAQNGYSTATMRSIAREAKVDTALIHHFFTSKEGVFAAAIEDWFNPAATVDKVLSAGTHDIGRRLVRSFLEMWADPESREPILAVIRSAVSYQDAARFLGEFVTSRAIGRIVEAIDAPQPELRASLAGSQLIGMAMIRYVIQVEPLASIDAEVIVECLGPTIDRYLTGDLSA
jgi:AcrR family transcriptional regulator